MSSFRKKNHGAGLKGQQKDTKINGVSKKVSKHINVPLLLRAEDGSSNLMTWKKRVSDLLLEQYGNLGRFTINGGEYFVPEEVTYEEEELTEENDPFGFKKDEVRERHRNRTKLVEAMKADRVPCFATIRSTLSPAMEESIKEQAEWSTALEELDPLQLWILAIYAASTDGPIETAVDSAYSSREKYNACVMESSCEESIVEFHERFEFAVEQMQSCNEVTVREWRSG